MSEDLTFETFTGHEGESFVLHVEDERLTLELVEVEHGKYEPMAEGLRDPFLLIFKGPKEPLATEGVFKVAHETLGELDLYLIPIVSPPGQQHYQSVFN